MRRPGLFHRAIPFGGQLTGMGLAPMIRTLVTCYAFLRREGIGAMTLLYITSVPSDRVALAYLDGQLRVSQYRNGEIVV